MLKDLSLHGFKEILGGNWYELRINKTHYGIHHNCGKYDWMIFQVCYSDCHYVLDVFYDDRRNRHILYSIPQVLEWVKMYKNI